MTKEVEKIIRNLPDTSVMAKIMLLEKRLNEANDIIKFYAKPETWQSYVFDMPPVIETDRENELSVCGKMARDYLRKYNETLN